MTNLTHHASRFTFHDLRFTFHVSRFTWAALVMVAALAAPRASAQSGIVIEDRGVTMEFPERLTFEARITSDAEVERVVLEYGVEKLTCGTVTAKAFPAVEPAKSVDVSWTWEMLQSGSEPPGAAIWYRWRAFDKAGGQAVSDEERIVWLDDAHDWRSISQDILTFHWYEGTRSFAEDLLGSAVESLERLNETTGIEAELPIDMYVYAGAADMREAILYEPGWTGGQARPEHDILLIGISPDSPDQVAWGRRAEAHELTHVLVGHLTFSCLGDVPTWLNEGIAVYAEGRLESAWEATLEDAIAADELISVRALSGGFSEHPDRADLSYTESYSLVNFLIAEYGPDKLRALFEHLRDGMTIEQALNGIYGFGLDGLEDAWRASIGAKPRGAEALKSTPHPTPVPTYKPIANTALAMSTLSPAPAPEAPPAAGTRPPAMPIAAQAVPAVGDAPIGAILVAAGIVGVVVIAAVALLARRRKSQ
jgi:hypothetical protein